VSLRTHQDEQLTLIDVAETSTMDPSPLVKVGVEPSFSTISLRLSNRLQSSSPHLAVAQSPQPADLALKSPANTA